MAEVAAECGLTLEEACEHSLGQLKLLREGADRNAARQGLLLLQVVSAGAAAPYSKGEGVKQLWGELMKQAQGDKLDTGGKIRNQERERR